MNQQTDGGQRNYLGAYAFAPSAGNKVILTQKADGIVIADTVTSTNAPPDLSRKPARSSATYF